MSLTGQPVAWAIFGVVVIGMLALDLGVFHRKSHVVGMKEALAWSGVWIALAVLFNAGVWHYQGPQTSSPSWDCAQCSSRWPA